MFETCTGQVREQAHTCVDMYVRSSSARRGRFSERSCRQRIARTLAKTCSAVRAANTAQTICGMPACTSGSSEQNFEHAVIRDASTFLGAKLCLKNSPNAVHSTHFALVLGHFYPVNPMP